MKLDPNRDTYEQIEHALRTVAVRLLLIAVFFFCLGYLVG